MKELVEIVRKIDYNIYQLRRALDLIEKKGEYVTIGELLALKKGNYQEELDKLSMNR